MIRRAPFPVLLLTLIMPCFAAGSSSGHYIGPEACSLCHKDIAAIQAKTAMANTWQGMAALRWPSTYDASVREGPDPALFSEIHRLSDRFLYSVTMPGQPEVTLPVEAIVGGNRHGLGFLSRIDQLGGIPLERSALIQARYAWSTAQGKLVLAPGCPVEKPHSYQTAFGLVLDPAYEQKCLSCHGQPNTLGAAKEGGVHCESCHGPGSQHLQAVGKGAPRQGIVNPKRLSSEESIAICAQCHVALGTFSDPIPDDSDLLVANQVSALQQSECFIQSGKAITCTTCHDPHNNAADDRATSIKACLGCHSPAAKPHAAICPVNSTSACLGCHMPSIEIEPFHLVDHLIRVHPEQQAATLKGGGELQSQIRPLREFLRIIVTQNREGAERASQRIANGEPFSRVARDLSSATALTGGYMGPKQLSDFDPVLADAAAKLKYGQTSAILGGSERWVILQRLPRDFMWQAEQLQKQADALALRGDLVAALERCQQALIIYPQFLRALTFMAKVLEQGGNPQRAMEVLRVTTSIYPNNARVKLNLALTLDKEGHSAEAIEACRRAIQLQPDLVPAYEYLGTALYSNEDLQGSIDVFRQGLQANPLSAELYYKLGLALARHGDAPGAKRASALAIQIDPSFISKK